MAVALAILALPLALALGMGLALVLALGLDLHWDLRIGMVNWLCHNGFVKAVGAKLLLSVSLFAARFRAIQVQNCVDE